MLNLKDKMETKQLRKKANGYAPTQNVKAKERLSVRKTYKLYIDGKFPRSESGRTFILKDVDGKTIANICRSSRKDLRDAVLSNKKAQAGWSARSAFNKGQIIYRLAETIESRKLMFIDVMKQEGLSDAESNVHAAIDLLVYYAGWTDKYIQLFSTVNPVESGHFNFSFPTPIGIGVVFGNETGGLYDMVKHITPIIAGGNALTLVPGSSHSLTAVELAEALHSSDVPGGVINILTGYSKDLIGAASLHMDVNFICLDHHHSEENTRVEQNASVNVKRVIHANQYAALSPFRILAVQEIKTTWHPVGS